MNRDATDTAKRKRTAIRLAFAAAFAVIIIALIVIDNKWQSPEKTEEKKISGGAEV